MAIEETIQRALAALADKSHKVNALPVSADVLRVLDHHGLVEFRTWTPSNQGRGPDGMEVYTPWTFGWFSPASSHGSTLEEILRKGTANGQEYISEVRLSQRGAALLAEWQLSSNRPANDGKEKDTPPRPATEPEANVRPDPVAVAIAILKDHPEWSNRKVAQAAGCHHTTLGRSEFYRTAKARLGEAQKERSIKRGWKDKDGNIEAIDE